MRYPCCDFSEITNSSLILFIKQIMTSCMLVFRVTVNGLACDRGVCMVLIMADHYCRFGNVRENLIFANMVPREFKGLANILNTCF